MVARIWQRASVRQIALAALLPFWVAAVSGLRAEETQDTDSGYFFKVDGARDCAFDASRDRLYVTTLKQLVVLDTKARKTVDSIDLLGGVQACDISPDYKFLAIAPIKAQFIYWIKLPDLEINQVRFKAEGTETGVFGLGVGFDNSVLFSMTYAGSGGVKLRLFNPTTKKVQEVGNVRMDSVITPSGDRRFAAVAEGNISSGPLNVFDFKNKQLNKIADLECFHYEIACAHGAQYFARPHARGCDLYDAKGGKLGTLDGRPVICAAFHPKSDSLFVMRHGEMNIQQYDVQGSKLANNYPLDKPLVITGDVKRQVVGQIYPVGPDAVMGTFRRVSSVHFRTFQSGRLKVSENGEKLFAVIPTGVYLFPIKPTDASSGTESKKRRINVIDADSDK